MDGFLPDCSILRETWTRDLEHGEKTKKATPAYLHKATWKNKFTWTPQEAYYHLNIIKQKLDFSLPDVSALTFAKKQNKKTLPWASAGKMATQKKSVFHTMLGLAAKKKREDLTAHLNAGLIAALKTSSTVTFLSENDSNLS